MVWNKIRYSITLLFVLFVPLFMSGQHKLDREKWKERTEDASYLEKKLEKKKTKPKQHTKKNLSWLTSAFKILLYIILIALIGLIIYFIVKSLSGKQNKQVKPVSISLDDEELPESIHNLELIFPLDQALKEENYRLAIRILFLQVLQSLNEKQAIQWSKDKTNRNYLNEMIAHKQYKSFEHITQVFELTWYGERVVNLAFYKLHEGKFNQFLTQKS